MRHHGSLATLKRSGIRKGLVVDLGCGSGLWARSLTDAGYEVLGMDGSAPMIALAWRVAPLADFRKGSFVDPELPRCDAVTAVGGGLQLHVSTRPISRPAGSNVRTHPRRASFRWRVDL
jgi:SAM-dependent methyltransferase